MAIDICDDMINLIISFLPHAEQITIAKKLYIHHFDRFVSRFGAIRALEKANGQGLFPHIFVKRVTLPNNVICVVDSSVCFGSHEDTFMRLFDAFFKDGHYICKVDAVPDKISQENARKIIRGRYNISTKTIVKLVPIAKERHIGSDNQRVKRMCIKYPEIASYYPYTKKELDDVIVDDVKQKRLCLEDFEKKYILDDVTFSHCARNHPDKGFHLSWIYDRLVQGRKIDKLTADVERLTKIVEDLMERVKSP